jgi:SAM-dependent methyltransferase
MPKPHAETKPVAELRKLVYGAMGVTDFETPTKRATHPLVWRYLNPFHDIDTPLSRMNHNPLKLPEEHLEKHFSVTGLKRVVRSVPEISAFLRKNLAARRSFDKVFQDAVFFHQVKSPDYWKESDETRYLTRITQSAEGVPAEMNEHNARLAAEELLVRTFPNKNKTVTVLDLGTGAGGTIIPVLERLKQHHHIAPEFIEKLKIYLNCLQPHLEDVKARLVELGLREENVVFVPTTFYAFSQAMGVKGMPETHPWPFADAKQLHELQQLRGNVDVIISGASMNNLPRSKLAFDTLHALLKVGGKAFLWDWGGFDLAKKQYSQKELDRVVRTTHGAHVTVRDNIKGFWRFWLNHHGYIDQEQNDERAWNELEKHIDNAEIVNVLGWFNKNYPALERYRNGRVITKLGHANRAYRTPEDVALAAKRAGFKIREISYPLADKVDKDEKPFWKKPNPRFVTWQAILEKPKQGVFKRFFYNIIGIRR